MSFTPEPLDSEFDPVEAAALIGKHVLVGLTYVDQTDELLEHKQVHGRIVRATKAEGVILALAPSGEELALPPVLDAFYPAEPGEYKLRSTGEVVVDPDFTATFTVRRPTKH